VNESVFPPRLSRLLLPALLIAATLVNLGTFHRDEQGDSIVPILVSLQKWTPFYWEQDRFGMMLPLLASPIRNALWNLLLQRELALLAGLSAIGLMARWAFPDRRVWPWVALLGPTLYLGLVPSPQRFSYLSGEQPYGVSLALGLAALLLTSPGFFPSHRASLRAVRLLAAAGLMVLAHWVNTGLVLALLPLIGFKALFDGPGLAPAASPGRSVGRWLLGHLRGVFGKELAVLAVGASAGYVFTRASLYRATQLNPIPLREWPHAWEQLASTLSLAYSPRTWIFLLLSLAVVGAGVLRLRHSSEGTAVLRRSAALLLAAAFYTLAIGTLKWLKFNEYQPRYVQPGMVMAQVALLGPAVMAFAGGAAWNLARRALGPALALPALAALHSYGAPSLQGPREDLLRMTPLVKDVLATGCTHIAGDYWTVWPAVYLSVLARQEQGEQVPTWGVTFRGSPTSGLALATPRQHLCIVVPFGQEAEAQHWFHQYGYPPLEAYERREHGQVLRPKRLSGSPTDG